MFKKIGINTVLYAIGPQIPKVLGFFMLPIFTKYLSSVDYGISGIIYSYNGLIGGLGDLGLHIRLANIYFKSPKKWITPWEHLFGFLSVWSIFFVLLQALLLYAVLPETMGINKNIIIALLSVSGILFNTTINFCYRLFQYEEKALYVSVISIVVGFVTILANYITIVHYRFGYLGWFLSTFIATVLQFCFCAYYMFWKIRLFPILKLKMRFIKKTLGVTLPLIPHNYATYILDSSDRFLLQRFGVSISEIGKYNFAYMFSGYLDFVISSLGVAISPTMYKIYFGKNKDRLNHLKTLIVLCQLLFFFLAFNAGMWLKEFLILFIRNNELKLVYPLAIILLIGYTYKPLYWYVNAILTYNNKTKSIWKITFTAAAVNIILNLLFIPRYSIYATAFSTLFSFLFLAFIGFSLRDFKSNNNIGFNLIYWFLSFVLVLGVCLFFMESSYLSKIIITLAGNIFFIILFYLNFKKVRYLII